MENAKSDNLLLTEKAIVWLYSKYNESKLPFLSSILFAFLAYTFAFTNKLINHDEASQLFAKGATVTSGRWGLGALDSVFPNYSMPWIYGVITVFLVAVSICIILRLFSIRNRLLQVLLAGSIMVFPSLIGTFGYMFTSSSYALSFFLAVLAVWFIHQRNWRFSIPALCCMILSLSIYQSYISIAASLLVLVLIQNLLHNTNPVAVLKQGIYFVAFLILSLAAYFVATKVVLAITGTGFSQYAGDSIVLSLSSIISGVMLAYSNFFAFFTESLHGLIPTLLSRYLHVLLLGAALLLLAIRILSMEQKNPLGIALLLVLILLLPLAVNCMYLITAEDSIHTLVLYSFVSVYLFTAVVADTVLTLPPAKKVGHVLCRIALNLLPVLLVLILTVNIYVANIAFLNLHLRYENAYAFYTSLVADIKMNPDFTEGTKLAVIGNYKQPSFYEEEFLLLDAITGVKGFFPDNYSNQEFLEYYIGFPMEFATAEEITAVSVTDAFSQMPVYPYYGSLKVIDGILVVRLS